MAPCGSALLLHDIELKFFTQSEKEKKKKKKKKKKKLSNVLNIIIFLPVAYFFLFT